MKVLVVLFLLTGIIIADSTSLDLGYHHRFLHGSYQWTSAPEYGVYKSQLEYPLTLSIGVMSLRFEYSRFVWRLDQSVHFSSAKGEGYDTDWVIDYMQYKARFKSRTTFNETVFRMGTVFNDYEIGLSGMYASYSFTMQDGYWILYMGEFGPFLHDGPIDRLDSIYRSDFKGIGIYFIKVSGLSSRVRLSYGSEYYFLGRVKGRGFWNLRNLEFRQRYEARQVVGWIDLSYRVYFNVNVRLGYRVTYMWADGRTTRAIENGLKWTDDRFGVHSDSLQDGAFIVMEVGL